MTAKTLTLAAEDAGDLEIISARLQDAVAQVQDLVWLPKTRRFAGVFNRFTWEAAVTKGRRGDARVRARLHFDGVLSVQSRNIKRDTPDAVVSLLAIAFTPKEPENPAGTVELVLAGGGSIRIEVEAIDAALTDIGGEWAALARPDHGPDHDEA